MILSFMANVQQLNYYNSLKEENNIHVAFLYDFPQIPASFSYNHGSQNVFPGTAVSDPPKIII